MVFNRIKWAYEGRSPLWANVRKEHIKMNPSCIACASTEKVEVHHIVPFHIDAVLELDDSNLLTMCRSCHLVLGHLKDFKMNNTRVVELIQNFIDIRRSVKNNGQVLP